MSIMKRAMMPNPMNKGILYRQTGGSTNPYAPDYGGGFDPNAPRELTPMPTPIGDSFWRKAGGQERYLDRTRVNPGQEAPGPTPGAPTIPNLPGVDAHEGLNEAIASGAGPVITEGMTPEEITNAYIEWASNPANIPDYYGGATVAEFDPLELKSFAEKEALAAKQNELNQQQLDYYQGILSGDSPHLQRAADKAAGSAATAFFGAGTPGSARGQYASELAAQEAQFRAQEGALQGIGGVQNKLALGADLLADVGGQRREYVQDVVNEDIKRWNFAQLAPQQQWDKLLGLAQQLKAMELGHTAGSEGSSVAPWKDILATGAAAAGIDSNILDSVLNLLNEGGPVYKQMGGPIPGQDPMAPPPGGEAPMPSGPGIMGAMGQPPAEPPMEKPGGIMGGEMMDMQMIAGPETSELDKAEGILQGLAAASGGSLKITRKTKGGKKK